MLPHSTQSFDCNNKNSKKSCYDSAHICPIRGRNFNPRTLGKCFYFVICMISRHGFQTKLLPNKALFWRFWGENVIFSLYNQPKTENIYKTLSPPPPCSKTPLISEMCIYKTHNLCKWGLGTRGRTMFYRLKMGEDQLPAHKIPL